MYGLRRQLLEGVEQKELILEDYVSGILSDVMDQFCAVKVHPEDWDTKGLKDAIFTRFGVDILAEGIKPEELSRQELGDAIFAKLKERYDAKEKLIGPDAMIAPQMNNAVIVAKALAILSIAFLPPAFMEAVTPVGSWASANRSKTIWRAR